MTEKEIRTIMYHSMCANPLKNRAICLGVDFTERLQELIEEQDWDKWRDKWVEYCIIVHLLCVGASGCDTEIMRETSETKPKKSLLKNTVFTLGCAALLLICLMVIAGGGLQT